MAFLSEILAIRKLTPTVSLVRFKRDPAFQFSAGQHLTLKIEGADVGVGYFSIASSPDASDPSGDEGLELIVRASAQANLVADVLIASRPGRKVSIDGPFGKFQFHPRPHRHACFVAQGTGVAPMLSMIKSREFADSQPLTSWFLAGFRDEAEWIKLDDLGVPPGRVQSYVTLSQPTTAQWQGLKGRVTDILKSQALAIDWGTTDFYLCGSPEMLLEVKALLKARGVPAGAVHSD